MSLRDKMNQMMSMMEQAAQQEQTSGSSGFFKPTTDSDGNGSAVIRFLPQKNLDQLPYVQTYSYYYKDDVTGKTYAELSPTTFGVKGEDAMMDFNSWLWNKGDAGQKEARNHKRNRYFYSNVLVVKDPGNPENEGKVMLYRFGVKIFEKINQALNPKEDPLLSIDEQQKPINVFDMWEGVDFRLRVKKVAGYPNYDDSEFSLTPRPIAKTDAEIEAIYEQTADLNERFMDKSKVKDKESQLSLLDKTLGFNKWWVEYKEEAGVVLDTNETAAPVTPVKREATPKPVPKAESKPKKEAETDTSDVDDILASLGV